MLDGLAEGYSTQSSMCVAVLCGACKGADIN